MITIFNRKEVLCTFDMKKQAQVREILAQNGIAYSIKTTNRKSPTLSLRDERMRTGTLGEKLQYEYEYQIFVKKEDYEKACFVMRQAR